MIMKMDEKIFTFNFEKPISFRWQWIPSKIKGVVTSAARLSYLFSVMYKAEGEPCLHDSGLESML